MIVQRSFLTTLMLIFSTANAFVPSHHRGAFSRTFGMTRLNMLASGGSADGEKHRRMTEFLNLDPIPETNLRKQRKERDSQTKSKFAAFGDQLWDLRTAMSTLGEELMHAISVGKDEAGYIRDQLRECENRDPELVYRVQLEEAMAAEVEGRMEHAKKHKDAALAARSCLPQFNLEGLWVGKYGDHGYEMINVTYVGDVLVAYKVTGDKNVPRSEITFQADLSPISMRGGSKTQNLLHPIKLTDKAAKKWGTKQLPRYNGLGQVAQEGFTNNQWMDGQLILIGEEYFSFAWVPIEHQIFFGRPSPELALKMLRDEGAATLSPKIWSQASPPSMDDDLHILRQYAAHCYEITTESIEEELEGDEFGCIWHGMDTEECYFE